LLKARWWDLDRDQILSLRPLLQSSDVDAVIEACNRIRGVAESPDTTLLKPSVAPAPVHPARPAGNEAGISSWCVRYLADFLDIAPERIDVDAPFVRLGLDSVGRASLMTGLEESLGVSITPDDIVEYPTIAALARFLATQDVAVSARA